MKHPIVLARFVELFTEYLTEINENNLADRRGSAVEALLSHAVLTHQLSVTPKLTKREMNCLFLAAKGMTTVETAAALGIKPSTVETYRRKIKGKLACNTMAQAVFEGIRFGYMVQNTNTDRL